MILRTNLPEDAQDDVDYISGVVAQGFRCIQGWRGPTQRINYEQLRSVQEKISKEEE